jgi:hypothetical protein
MPIAIPITNKSDHDRNLYKEKGLIGIPIGRN